MGTFAARQAPSTRPRPRSPRCPPRAARSSPPCARAGAPAGPASHLPARPGAPRSHAQACQTATWGARFPPAPEFGARTTDQLEAAAMCCKALIHSTNEHLSRHGGDVDGCHVSCPQEAHTLVREAEQKRE
ncbi:caskin-1-like isoform X2 [Orcinus orca]|uniref:caskin-1-like isoform X2 n=1 Tax=Orcinus orca TaxID=9733 RepID=UPI0021137333|nr:caskin-1-like isoform X2 [Orcinus orca]